MQMKGRVDDDGKGNEMTREKRVSESNQVNEEEEGRKGRERGEKRRDRQNTQTGRQASKGHTHTSYTHTHREHSENKRRKERDTMRSTCDPLRFLLARATRWLVGSSLSLLSFDAYKRTSCAHHLFHSSFIVFFFCCFFLSASPPARRCCFSSTVPFSPSVIGEPAPSLPLTTLTLSLHSALCTRPF